MDANGEFLVAWHRLDGSDTNIYVQRYDTNQQPLENAFQVNSSNAGPQGSAPAVASSPTGDFVVGWESADSDGTGVVAKVFDASRRALTDEITLPAAVLAALGALVGIVFGADEDQQSIAPVVEDAAGNRIEQPSPAEEN